MDIVLTYADLYAIVERSISIIGKRSTDDKGNLLFKDITLGSREKELIHDYFRQAVIDLSAETEAFISGESSNGNDITANSALQISFWTDQNISEFFSRVTASGQLLYNYSTRQLHTSVVTFPFTAASPTVGDLYVYNDNYYSWNNGLTQLSSEGAEALTDEQKAAATTLKYFNQDVQTVLESEAGIYAYYNNVIYVSQQFVVFRPKTPQANVIYYAPDGFSYQWQYGTMQRVLAGNDESVSITLTFPDNHNIHLEKFILDSCKAYCVSFALHSWFTITAPKIANKYLEDYKRQLAAVIRLIYGKKAPEAAESSPLDISTSII